MGDELRRASLNLTPFRTAGWRRKRRRGLLPLRRTRSDVGANRALADACNSVQADVGRPGLETLACRPERASRGARLARLLPPRWDRLARCARATPSGSRDRREGHDCRVRRRERRRPNRRRLRRRGRRSCPRRRAPPCPLHRAFQVKTGRSPSSSTAGNARSEWERRSPSHPGPGTDGEMSARRLAELPRMVADSHGVRHAWR